MFHQRYLNKNKGMTLIETIVSMWILGIVIVSMLSFVGATMSKRNQNRIQAIAVAKSELQDSEMSIRVEGNSDPIDHATILLFKSSYLADLENNEIKIEEENAFFTKYVIEATNKEVFVEDSKGVSSNNISNNASSNGSNNVSSNRVLDNNKEQVTEIKTSNVKIQKEDSSTNGLGDVLKKFVNEVKPNGPGERDKGLLPNISDTEIQYLFDVNNNEKDRYDKYKEIEDAFINYEKKNRDDGLNSGFKCFILLTTYKKEQNSEQQKIETTVKTLYSSEKKNDGYYPLSIYEIKSNLRLGTGIVN